MVSKEHSILSLLLPIALIIGGSISIYAYKQANTVVWIMSYVIGLIIVVFFYIKMNSKKKRNV
jgi:hypothetical protein